MASNTAETLIGAVVLAAAAGFVTYAATIADLSTGASRGATEVIARFGKAEGVAPGGDVRVAGVKVGTISEMVLDSDTYEAKLTLAIDPGVQIPDDTQAKITSASLLGDSYVALEVGGSEFMLESGDEILYTQSSVSVGDLIGRFIHGETSSD
jgi:phospholipid/cholesterol/gamma-HCH transport system substrate-binding protein